MASKFRQLRKVSEDIEAAMVVVSNCDDFISKDIESCGQERLRMVAGSVKNAYRWNQDVKEAIR